MTRDPVRRPRQLAFALLALGLLSTAVGGVVPTALRWPARLGLLFVVPTIAGVVASLLLPRDPKRIGRSARIQGTAPFHLVIAAALGLELLPVVWGAYSSQAYVALGHPLLARWPWLPLLVALPFTIAAATLGTEWALRARLWSVTRRRGGDGEATGWSLLCGTALAIPALAPGFAHGSWALLVPALGVALARQGVALTLFRGGGLFVAGTYQGTLVALEAFGLGPANGFYAPALVFASGGQRFDLARVAAPLAAWILAALVARRGGREEPA